MSRFIEYVKMAVQNILANKGRSFLTVLGIIIGIASVIMIIAVGNGTANQMKSDLSGLVGGVVIINISEDAIAADELITEDDMITIKEKIDGVIGIMPLNLLLGETVTGKGDFSTQIYEASVDTLDIYSLELKRGRNISEKDIIGGQSVCTILDSDAKRLFGSDDVVGMTIDFTNAGVSKEYEIIGVFTEPEHNVMITYTYEGAPILTFAPYTAQEDFGSKYEYSSIQMKLDQDKDNQKLINSVIKLLEARHQSYGEEYFRVESYSDMVGQINAIMGVMTLFISCVAAISLLVGGIGVMNIMLVSVTERTREIGIRKSLGAKTTSIMLQFLAESAILTILGGILGIILGLLGAFGLCSLIGSMLESNIKPGLNIGTIMLATLFSCAVGIFFGIYPARKAAKLSPIEALRRN